MPTRLPDRSGNHAIVPHRSSDRPAGVALAIALTGLVLGAIVYVVSGDRYIVSYLMLVAAAVAMLTLRWDVDPHAPN